MDEERLLDLSNVEGACSPPGRLDFDPLRMLGDAEDEVRQRSRLKSAYLAFPRYLRSANSANPMLCDGRHNGLREGERREDSVGQRGRQAGGEIPEVTRCVHVQLDPIKAQQRAALNEKRRRAIESRRSKSRSRPSSSALSTVSSLNE